MRTLVIATFCATLCSQSAQAQTALTTYVDRVEAARTYICATAITPKCRSDFKYPELLARLMDVQHKLAGAYDKMQNFDESEKVRDEINDVGLSLDTELAKLLLEHAK